MLSNSSEKSNEVSYFSEESTLQRTLENWISQHSIKYRRFRADQSLDATETAPLFSSVQLNSPGLTWCWVQALHIHDTVINVIDAVAVVAETEKFSEVAGMRRETARRWHWAVTRSVSELLRPEMRGAKWRLACGRNHDVGTGSRTQSLARMNLGHKPEVLCNRRQQIWTNKPLRKFSLQHQEVLFRIGIRKNLLDVVADMD